jgi:ribosomal-protein-alanine N-acetyltransferase
MTVDRDILGPLPSALPLTGAAVVAPFRLGDLQAVARLQKRAFRPPLAYGRATLLLLWALPHVRFLVARSGGTIVGCAIGDRDGSQSRVINICVDPEMRRRGIGTMLLQELEAELPIGDVVLMVEDGNAAAEALYRREGYLPVGVSRGYYGRGRDGIWMQKHRTLKASPKIRV